MQETKVPTGQQQDEAEQTARNSRWNASLQACSVSAVGGKSAGVAVAVRTEVGLAQPAVTIDNATGPEPSRVGIRRIGAVCPGGLHVGSCYLTSAVGVTASCNLKLLESLAFVLSRIRGPWVLAGDWNCTPQELTDTGWLQLVGGVVVAPLSATCNDRVLDYFVVAQQFSHNVLGCRTVCAMLGSTHTLPHACT